MRAERVLRSFVWICAGTGVFFAFAWPFVVSPDPDDATLRLLARGLTIDLLIFLSGAAVVRARAAGKRKEG